MRQKCAIVLSNGYRFEGTLIGAPVRASGELVFTTGMVGYSEAITDPSYFGQILTFTYPLIGNYGVPETPSELSKSIPQGFESFGPKTAGVIVTIDSIESYHWNSFQTLDEWLKAHNVPGIIGLDTRHLVHLIRSAQTLMGRIEPEEPSGTRYASADLDLHENAFFDPGTTQIIDQVSVKEPKIIGKGSTKIAVIDCGVKWNIVRQLVENDCEVHLLPWNHDFSEINADGWVVSNGPGDPTRTGDLKKKIRQLFEKEKPIFGICLGHQLICLAAGATTKRITHGHRSQNQPVYEVGTRKGYITTQNHGYVVEDHSLPKDWLPWFRNVNDDTIEGIRHKFLPIRSVQFHPEAAGGPRDTAWVTESFIKEVKK